MELTELNKALISIQGHINNAKNEIEDFQTNHNDDSDLLEQAKYDLDILEHSIDKEFNLLGEE